ETAGSTMALAKSLRAKANALYSLDQHSSAIEMHERAAALFEVAGEQLELARSLSGSIQPLLLLGRYDQALAAGERARNIFADQGNAWRLARLEINIGNIYHRQDRFTEALACYERAYEELLSHDDAEGLAAVLSNLSLCHISLNGFAKSLELHQKARQHCEQKGMPVLIAYADYNIAYLYFLRGEYGRAIQMLREAAASARKANDAYQMALCNEGRLFEARRLCMTAREFFSASIMPSKAVLAELLLARIALRLNDSLAARQHCDSALQQLKALQRPVLACQAEFLSGKIEQ